MKTARQMMIPAALFAMTAIANPAAHGATALYDDPFTDGGVSDGADPQDLAWGSPSAVSPAVAVDATIGTGNAFVFNSTGTFSRVLAPIDPIQLAPTRDKIRIEFDLHPTVLLNTDSGIRFGIRDSTANAGVFDSYSGNYGTGTDTRAALLADHNGTFGGATQEVLTPQDNDGTATKDDNGSTLSDTALHRAMLTVQYTEAGRVDVRARMDTRVAAAAHTGNINTFFNQVGFSTGGSSGQDFNFDNYRITRWHNVIDDTFDLPGGAASRGNDASDPNDTAWHLYQTGQTVTIVDDDAGIGSNDALQVAATNFRRIVGGLEAFTLGWTGARAELSFDARFTSLPSGSSLAGAFRFGLFNDAGTPWTADGLTAADDDDSGYHVQLGLGTNASVGVVRDNDIGNEILGGGSDTPLSGSETYAGIDDAIARHFVFAIERTALGLNFELYIDGVLVMTEFDNDTANADFTTTFNEIGFGVGNNSLTYIIDNVVVDVSIPTPAAMPAGLALLALAACRERRRTAERRRRTASRTPSA